VSEVVRVRGSLFQKVLINPAVNYAGLETVLVVTSYPKEAVEVPSNAAIREEDSNTLAKKSASGAREVMQ
jgi:hypothetical protein